MGQDFPSFSIILETENLANADLKGLARSIASLAAQDPAPTMANEVILIESGDTPIELLHQLCAQYPWIQVHEAPLGTTYYQAKMLGAELATGDIVVYYDSDCVYVPNWLRLMLTPFMQSPEIEIVAGETTTKGVGFYGTAMAMTYIFPQYSGDTKLAPTRQYFLNNVAFRRSFLLDYPIPTMLPLYRGNCSIHAHDLRDRGVTIWRQPQARALHAPPNGLAHFFWRFLLIGHDYYWQKRLLAELNLPSHDPTMNGAGGKWLVFRDRIGKLMAREPLHALFFPFAIPIMVVSSLLIYAGFLITSRSPKFLLEKYQQVMGGS